MIIATTPINFRNRYNKDRSMGASLCIAIDGTNKRRPRPTSIEELCAEIEAKKQADVNPSQYWGSIARVRFDNIQTQQPKRILFSEDEASEILGNTLDKDLDVRNYEHIVVVCSMDKSRGAAVALFLAQLKAERVILDLKGNGWVSYNPHVFEILRNTYDDWAEEKGLPKYNQKVILRD